MCQNPLTCDTEVLYVLHIYILDIQMQYDQVPIM